MRPGGEARRFLGGFVAAEGCFTRSANRFRFALALGSKDKGMCVTARAVLGVGRIWSFWRRQPHYDHETVFAVGRTRDLVDTVVPFMDVYLPPSLKRDQYLGWRDELLDFWEHDAKRRRPCTVEGCGLLQRGKGLCRKHYYATYRR